MTHPAAMQLLVFQRNPQGLLELVSEPAVDDEDEPVFLAVVPLDDKLAA